MKPQIVYYRVSTKNQGVSGLGLDAQKSLVFGFLKKQPDYEFTEIESGKKDSRPVLQKALQKCEEVGGRLVIAKLDRLARSVYFVSGLLKSKVDFVCCDNPNATPLILHLLSAVAESEAEACSQRTKAALASKVQRERLVNPDFRLGPPPGCSGFSRNRESKEGKLSYAEIDLKRREGIKNRVENNPNLYRLESEFRHLLSLGLNQKQMTKVLNDKKIESLNGVTVWNETQVSRMVKKIKAKSL